MFDPLHLTRLERLLETLEERLACMPTAADLQTAVDALKAAVAALVAAHAAPPLITQQELDSVTAEVQAITASIPPPLA